MTFPSDSNIKALAERKITVPHNHKWSAWKEIGRTGDWFHPLIVERKCAICGSSETDEH